MSFNGIFEQAEEESIKLKIRQLKLLSQRSRKKVSEGKSSLKDPYETLSSVTKCHYKSSRRRERKRYGRDIEEIMAEKFPVLVKDVNLHIQTAERTLNRINL